MIEMHKNILERSYELCYVNKNINYGTSLQMALILILIDKKLD